MKNLGGCVLDNAGGNLQKEPARHLFAAKQERKQRHANLSSRIQPDQGRAVDVFFYPIVLDENDSSSSPNDVRDTT
eukprot:scaffold324_cov326-Pavlova_lutheri.AAC.22